MALSSRGGRSPFETGDGFWGSGPSFRAPLAEPFAILEKRPVGIVGPPGSGKRVALRETLQGHIFERTILMRLDGREVRDLAELTSALLALAQVATDRWRRAPDLRDLTAAWATLTRREQKAARDASSEEWRAMATYRREAVADGGPRATWAEVHGLWRRITSWRPCTPILLIEQADHWLDRLPAADLDALCQWRLASDRPGVSLVLMGRGAAPLERFLAPADIERITPPVTDEVVAWLQARFQRGGWELSAPIARMLIGTAQQQPTSIVRLADHLWRRLDPSHVLIDDSDVRRALWEAVRTWSPAYEATWSRCTPVQRQVIRLLIRERGERPTRRRPADFPLRPSSIQRALESLEADHIVWREEGHGGRVHWADALFRYWAGAR